MLQTTKWDHTSSRTTDQCPFGCANCKLNDTQLNYTVGDKELLSIAMVLMDFCTMLLGANCINAPIIFTLPQTTQLLIMSFACSTLVNSKNITFTLSLTKTMPLLTHFHVWINSISLSSLRKTKFISSKILYSKE